MNRNQKPSPTKTKQPQANSRQKASNPKEVRRSGFNRRPAVAKKSVKRRQRGKKPAIANRNAVKRSPNLRPNVVKSGSPQANRSRTPRSRSPIWLAIYVATIAVGLSTILGSVVSVVGSWQSTPPTNPAPAEVSAETNQNKLDNLFSIASLGREITALKTDLQQLATEYPDLEPEIFLVDLDTKGFVSISGGKTVASASTIKLPILVAFFQDVDRGKIELDERLTMTQNLIAGGSGNMQYAEPGTEFSALETADKMMTISDNTATNMLIERMGGMERLNRQFSQMGLKATRLNNPLPDLTGTNVTTPEDLGNLLVKIDRGDLISLRSRDRLMHIMRNVERNTLLPEGLESGATIAHKTGDIKSVLADVGIIDMPNGKRYIASILVKRPDNDPQAKEFIQRASGVAYQYFKNPRTASFNLEDD